LYSNDRISVVFFHTELGKAHSTLDSAKEIEKSPTQKGGAARFLKQSLKNYNFENITIKHTKVTPTEATVSPISEKPSETQK